jgi:hypothetical protein
MAPVGLTMRLRERQLLAARADEIDADAMVRPQPAAS